MAIIAQFPKYPHLNQTYIAPNGTAYVWSGTSWVTPQNPSLPPPPKVLYGPTGPQGNQGLTGPEGPMGQIGAAGADGLPGPAGPAGPTGGQGIGWQLRGTVDSVADIPAGSFPGEGYILTGAPNTGHVVVYNLDTGTWDDIGVVQGPQGVQGPRGFVGPTGAAGVGFYGPAGPTGPSGPPGYFQSLQFPASARYIGPNGTIIIDTDEHILRIQDGETPGGWVIGAQGPSGPIGLPGPAGAAGPTGPAAANGGGSMASRATLQLSTPLMVDSSMSRLSAPMSPGFLIYSISVDAACWIRVYSDISSSNDDLSRLISVSAPANSGLLAELIADGAKSYTFTPPPVCFNNENPVGDTIPILVTNLSGSTRPIGISITYLQLEVLPSTPPAPPPPPPIPPGPDTRAISPEVILQLEFTSYSVNGDYPDTSFANLRNNPVRYFNPAIGWTRYSDWQVEVWEDNTNTWGNIPLLQYLDYGPYQSATAGSYSTGSLIVDMRPTVNSAGAMAVVGKPDSLPLNFGSQDWTVEFWLSPKGAQTNNVPIIYYRPTTQGLYAYGSVTDAQNQTNGTQNTAANTMVWSLMQSTNGANKTLTLDTVYGTDSAANGIIPEAPGGYPRNGRPDWSHVAIVYDQTNSIMKLYVNGSLSGTVGVQKTMITSCSLFLFGFATGGNWFVDDYYYSRATRVAGSLFNFDDGYAGGFGQLVVSMKQQYTGSYYTVPTSPYV